MVSCKENCPEPTHDAFSWITPVVLEDGWLDKMDSSVEGEFFPDLSWSDSPSDPFSHATSVVDETPPAKKLTSQPHAKPTSKKAKGDALRSMEPHTKLHPTHQQVHPLSKGHSTAFLDDLPPPQSTIATAHASTTHTPSTTWSSDGATVLQPSHPPSSAKKRSWGGWTWDDQTVFFQAMKSKWNSPAQLPKRWDQLTRKLPHKSVRALHDFYHAMVSHVHTLLSLVHVHLNLDSPDEIRLALSCWHRVCSSELDISNPLHKKRLAGRLKHTLLKSRKSSEAAMSAAAKHSKKTASTNVSTSPNGVGAGPLPAVVHTPIVRKKRPLVNSPMPPVPTTATTTTAASSPPQHNIATPWTLLDYSTSKRRKPSPPPSSMDARKRQIKVRFVPIDKATQTLVADIGARPKVELTMNGSKRISDVCTHMMAKWAAVHTTSDDVRRLFRVVPLGDRVHPGWGVDDISVSCLDILHQCPRQPATDDDTVTLEYRWDVAPSSSSSTTASVNPTLGAALPQPLLSDDPTYVNLDFLPLPSPHNDDDDDDEPWHDLRDLSPPLAHPSCVSSDSSSHAVALSSTDFNGFLDEGPGACTAWMESFLPPPPVDLAPTTAQPTTTWQGVPSDPSTKKKRITPTLIKRPSPPTLSTAAAAALS
ncbi:hypothetical protein DYB25_009803 [Aphanomyces astaci]|uniref:Uncharacterized protein n=1 Tax=Aphanomyces astaci TaxID=112090 RepID=A0A397BP62_APHAT|nr:hypothetical protein DYB25_009803 [Aphanomyces astaci]